MNDFAVGSVVEAEIADITLEGMGFFKLPNGLAAYAANTWPGDRGQFKITRLKKRFAQTELVKLTSPSSERRDSPCPHFGWGSGQCGGCPWSIVSYEAQIQQKRKMLNTTLNRTGLSFSGVPTLPLNFEVIPSPSEWAYRNRAQLKTDGKSLGYVSRGSKSLAPVKNCMVLNSSTQDQLIALVDRLPNSQWEPHGKFKFNFLELDDEVPTSKITLNKKRPFKQGNSEQNEAMKKWLKTISTQWSGPTLELFAGSGNFTGILATNDKLQITASELYKGPLDTIKKNFQGVTAIPADLYNPSEWKDFSTTRYRNLVLDPPRTGFPQLADFIEQQPDIENIIYISCDLHTLGKDIAGLKDLGFTIQAATGVDQFPQTPHLESLIHLVR